MKTYKIGRLSSNDICFPNEQVSRLHADLTCMDDGSFMITDHSKNGTTVNGRPLSNTSMQVKYGDNILFGNVAHLDWSQIQTAAPVPQSGGRTEYVPGPVDYPNHATGGSNGMAIAGFIMAFIIPLLGLIFSIIGLNRANERPDQKGRGLAIAGIILSSVLMLINLIIVIIVSALG